MADDNVLKAQVQRVLELRGYLEDSRAGIRELEERVRLEYKPLYDDRISQEAQVREAEEKLRQMGLELYQQTGEKQLPYGLGVRVRNVLSYDPLVAFEWALKHGIGLRLEKGAFEAFANALARGGEPLGFVTSKEEPTITIAQDLEKVLAEGETT